MHLFLKSKKGGREAKAEILNSRIMITPEEDLNPEEKHQVLSLLKNGSHKRSVDYGKENRRRKRSILKKMTNKTLQP